MAEVIREGDDVKHLDKLLDKLGQAQKLKAQCIAGEVAAVTIECAEILVNDAQEAYNYFKGEYGL